MGRPEHPDKARKGRRSRAEEGLEFIERLEVSTADGASRARERQTRIYPQDGSKGWTSVPRRIADHSTAASSITDPRHNVSRRRVSL